MIGESVHVFKEMGMVVTIIEGRFKMFFILRLLGVGEAFGRCERKEE